MNYFTYDKDFKIIYLEVAMAPDYSGFGNLITK